MKILFITPSFKTGGGNRVFIELANQLCKKHEVHILFPNNSQEKNTFTIDNRIFIRSVGKYSSSKIKKIGNIFKTIRYANREYSQFIQIISDPIFSIFSGQLKSPQLFRFIQIDDYRIYDDGTAFGKGKFLSIYKKLCIRSYKNKNINFIFNSQYIYDLFCKDSGRSDVPYQLVLPSIDSSVFNPGDRTADTREKKLRISLIARKHLWKGLPVFIDAWNSLPDAIKSKFDPPLLISHDNLSGFDTTGMTIFTPGSDREIADKLRGTDIFISTSWFEGFGLPPLEAMACGCCCIISESGGVNEYAEHNVNCLMYPPGNTRILNDHIIRLTREKNLREFLVKNARETVKTFNWEYSAEQCERIINFTNNIRSI